MLHSAPDVSSGVKQHCQEDWHTKGQVPAHLELGSKINPSEITVNICRPDCSNQGGWNVTWGLENENHLLESNRTCHERRGHKYDDTHLWHKKKISISSDTLLWGGLVEITFSM